MQEINHYSEINYYSQILRKRETVIDDYNCHTDNICILEKVTFIPIYRVFGRNKSNSTIVGEKYFLDVGDASKYWAQLAGEKECLF